MKAKTIIISSITLIIIAFLAGVYTTHKIAQPQKQQTIITSQSILTLLKQRSFLINQTYIFNESITIEKKYHNIFKNFLFGQKIKAHAIVEVNLGVDLSQISNQDIQISADKITIKIPSTKIFNSRIIGPIDLQNEQGILKKIFKNDDGYNEAQKTLIKQAEEKTQKKEILKLTNEKSKKQIQELLKLLTNHQIEVIFLKK